MEASEQEVAARKAADAKARKQRALDWTALLKTGEGRRCLELLVFEFGGLQEQPHHPDPYQRSFNDGQRQVAIALDQELRLADLEGWARMHTDRIARIRDTLADAKPHQTDQ